MRVKSVWLEDYRRLQETCIRRPNACNKPAIPWRIAGDCGALPVWGTPLATDVGDRRASVSDQAASRIPHASDKDVRH